MSDAQLPPPADPTPATAGIPAGWYPDPSTGAPRWWTGTTWATVTPPAASKGVNGWGIAALVTGVIASISLILSFAGPAVLFGILAVLCGIDGLTKKWRARGVGMAIAGLILGALPLLIAAFFLILYANR